jgi:hypothetical protein
VALVHVGDDLRQDMVVHPRRDEGVILHLLRIHAWDAGGRACAP